MLGAHLDSVTDGGRFDGTVGEATSFEVVRVPRNLDLEVTSFTGKRGGIWASLPESRQLTRKEELRAPRGNLEVFQDALQRAGLTNKCIFPSAWHPKHLLVYLEFHIEQETPPMSHPRKHWDCDRHGGNPHVL